MSDELSRILQRIEVLEASRELYEAHVENLIERVYELEQRAVLEPGARVIITVPDEIEPATADRMVAALRSELGPDIRFVLMHGGSVVVLGPEREAWRDAQHGA